MSGNRLGPNDLPDHGIDEDTDRSHCPTVAQDRFVYDIKPPIVTRQLFLGKQSSLMWAVYHVTMVTLLEKYLSICYQHIAQTICLVIS